VAVRAICALQKDADLVETFCQKWHSRYNLMKKRRTDTRLTMTGHEDAEGCHRYISALSLTFALGRGEWITPAKPLYPLDIVPIHILWDDGRISQPACTGPDILAPTGIRTPASYTRSESLHGLRCPCPYYNLNMFQIIFFLS